MKVFALIVQNLIRLLFLVLLVIGIMFWTGHAFNLLPLHMHLGESLVGLLWILAVFGMVARVSPILTVGAILWGALVVFFGRDMGSMLPGPAHEAIRVIHLLIGLIAVALAEMIGARIKRRTPESVA
jgi:uncharacterized membrane protein YuzA (DUF378 family)